MEIRIRKKSAVIASLKGRMDALSYLDFEQALQRYINEGEKYIILDCNDLDYISSAGMRSILVISNKVKAVEGRLFLAGLKDMVKKIFEISGSITLLHILNSVEAAYLQIP